MREEWVDFPGMRNLPFRMKSQKSVISILWFENWILMREKAFLFALYFRRSSAEGGARDWGWIRSLFPRSGWKEWGVEFFTSMSINIDLESVHLSSHCLCHPPFPVVYSHLRFWVKIDSNILCWNQRHFYFVFSFKILLRFFLWRLSNFSQFDSFKKGTQDEKRMN